ncbi:glucosaminidase domain-containing protein [Pseudoalteromonas sp. MMG022]|uniref:glucosaminidase domain-containing protein n=1 Tax=Pseudoalteromonas sp. MMG022 TaxID=2909978 RepID=UPI001F00C01F|nr:glucosaminidase domain-containing protein [Pseudoalteromonas sp. MMG022]MCF6436171.1 glucosaminidase domain-containing protein [Pseudoalteromonas sp. MMG022]
MQVRVIQLVIFLVSVWALSYPFLYETTYPLTSEQTIKPKKPSVPKVVEKPLHTVKLPDFSSITDVKEKKQRFFDFIKPHVIAENTKIRQQRATLEIALMMLQMDEALTKAQTKKLNNIFAYYRLDDEQFTVESVQEALKHVDIIPRELALMQAANESAWGTSRFARIGLNFFGQWCYKKGCGMVPRDRNDEAAHEVAAFQSVRAAVKSYFRNINTHDAYRQLREKRAELRANKLPIEATLLTQGLVAYSERGDAYVEELNDMIRHNKDYFDEE